ncbi:unnamed protein product [Parnassius apollo]|uniref:(apollo) hypothetical protein n=1 Tax=Parnassius apollo TaxID=110799 RepID=A0A8S3Y4B3_PARAO|nr:unnamed protein product [Parnassius apollo]
MEDKPTKFKKKELKILQEKDTPPESDSEDFLERNFELQQEHQDYENQKKAEKQKLKESIEPVCKKLKNYNLLKELPKITRKSNRKEKESTKKEQIDIDIRCFYEDDDNSRMTSGKKDCITLNKQKKQKRFLKDSLLNLHKKFLEKYDYNVSYSYFCKAKPFWVIVPTEKDRETCMCKIHENVDLLAKALHKNEIIVEKSAKEILSSSVCNIYNIKCLENKYRVCINKGLTMWGSGLKEVRTKNGLRIIKITEKKQFRGKPSEVLLLLLNREERSRNNFQKQFEEHLLQNQKSDEEDEGEPASCSSLEVAKIQRSEAFLARTNAELPRELQDIKTAKFEEQTFCLSQDVSMIIETSAVNDINSDLDITLEPSEIVMFETSTPFEAAPIYAETLIALPGASTADNEAISDPMNVSCVNPLDSEFDEASSNILGLEKAKLRDLENIFVGCYVVPIMTVVEAAVSVGSVTGSIASSYVLRAVGHVYLLAVTLQVAAYVFTNVCLEEPLRGAVQGTL